MGGGNAGDIASSSILHKMSEAIPETFKMAASGFYPDCLDHLTATISSVHEQINEAAIGENSGMAATLALAWFTPDNLYIANVGDSRIYRSRNGTLEQLTRDHTSAWAQLNRGEISEVEYRNHPRRAALYEVVGGNHPTVHPYFAAIPYEKDDRFLICSDGLIDGVWDRHISNALSEPISPHEAAQRLLNRSLDNSGIDDTTLIVIHVLADSHELHTHHPIPEDLA